MLFQDFKHSARLWLILDLETRSGFLPKVTDLRFIRIDYYAPVMLEHTNIYQVVFDCCNCLAAGGRQDKHFGSKSKVICSALGNQKVKVKTFYKFSYEVNPCSTPEVNDSTSGYFFVYTNLCRNASLGRN